MCLKKCGMSIQEMKEYLQLCLQGEATIPRRQELLAKKQEELRASIRELEDSIAYIDFKDAELLKKFQTEKGRILPRRITGTCLKHQKMLAVAVKRARIVSLVL